MPDLCRKIDRLLLTQPAPDAYFVAFSNHVHATIGHLARRRHLLPEKVSVISRMDAQALAESIPTVARYQMDAERLGRSLGRLMLKALNPTAGNAIGQYLVMPEFVDGETAGGHPPGL